MDCRWPGCPHGAVVIVAHDEGYCRTHGLEVADREARLWAMERYRRRCRRCDRSAHDVHHAITRSQRYIRHERANLLPLCRACHTWAHRNRAAFHTWVESMAPGMLAGLWVRQARGEARHDHVDLAAVIRGFREEQLTADELERYRSGAWLG